MIIKQPRKEAARLNPLECELCENCKSCGFGQIHEEMHRLRLSIRFSDCAIYNGGKLFKGEPAAPKAVQA